MVKVIRSSRGNLAIEHPIITEEIINNLCSQIANDEIEFETDDVMMVHEKTRNKSVQTGRFGCRIRKYDTFIIPTIYLEGEINSRENK